MNGAMPCGSSMWPIWLQLSSDMKRDQGVSAYIFVTLAYWAFMLSDGALRMLVLLHFHTLGYSPVQLAYLFVFYEVAGIVTNLAAGWIAARFGLNVTLYAGLSLQIVALLALAQLDVTWAIGASVLYVMVVQGLSGVAKDLAKMSAKSAVKLLAPKTGGGLFRWVALLTGSKNAVKGFGFLLGALLLAQFGFTSVVYAMALVLAIILALLLFALPTGLSQKKKDAKFKDVFSKNANVNWLSFSRVFLFGARDVWFVVAIPIYFYAVLSDGSLGANKSAFFMIGTFMAVWVILYGAVQARAPKLLKAAQRGESALVSDAFKWIALLSVLPAALALWLFLDENPNQWLTTALIVGLLAFGVLFATCSALHSYLILSFTEKDRVTLDVGFYYMANASGRLLGTLLSGVTYQIGGLWLCLAISSAMLVLSAQGARKLRSDL